MNLLKDKWLPVVRRSGAREVVRVADIVDGIDSDPIVRVDACRPEFDACVTQFLIGVISTLQLNEDLWMEWCSAPPDAAHLAAELDSIAYAFEMEGDGPRFMQAHPATAKAAGKATKIGNALIGGANNSSAQIGADFYVMEPAKISRSTAAMILITHSTTGYSKGGGFLGGLRGNSPVSVVALSANGTLWHDCLLNAEIEDVGVEHDIRSAFPWMNPEPTRPVTPAEVHPLHVLWPMARRVRLIFGEAGVCDMTGEYDDVTVTGFTEPRGGIAYKGGWRHPLTPAVLTKKDGMRPLQMRPGASFGWDVWPDLSYGGRGGDKAPAVKRIELSHARRQAFSGVLWAHGFANDQAKVCSWMEAKMPLYDIDGRMEAIMRAIVDATRKVSSMVYGCASTATCVKRAGRKEGAVMSAKLGDASLWARTEGDFIDLFQRITMASSCGDDISSMTEGWIGVLSRHALALFDDLVDYRNAIKAETREMVKARQRLKTYIHSKPIAKMLGVTKGEK